MGSMESVKIISSYQGTAILQRPEWGLLFKITHPQPKKSPQNMQIRAN